ncbi:MAG: hypothetical protein J5965_03870 [Aeriscardovia sp.]|nr:hypothetical protein [Aeriscardovia sp.]
MRKVYIKPIVEVEQLQIEGLMQDGHSYNMPTAKDNQGWGIEEDEDGQVQSNNLWDNWDD